ncbi:unnamed protein product [Allacma fusca]|uniref:Uncharacterized protein n=1 Tax=Allacma fusca TaxID=39272 RepID=A0A8J2LMH4_9HEXA|nr:unnamed protein product [Allacma fusca]
MPHLHAILNTRHKTPSMNEHSDSHLLYRKSHKLALLLLKYIGFKLSTQELQGLETAEVLSMYVCARNY